MTNEGMGAVAAQLCAVINGGGRFARHHELIGLSAVIVQALVKAPGLYPDSTLGRMITETARTLAALEGEDSPEARAARHLVEGIQRLAAETLMERTPVTAGGGN